MSIEVNSPFNGQPVKIRPQDVGKAVRDSEGRIFYALPKSDGSGYYGAMTKAGGEKDEQRALKAEERSEVARGVSKARSAQEMSSARSSKKSGGMLKLIIVLAILGAAAWAVTMGPLKGMLFK